MSERQKKFDVKVKQTAFIDTQLDNFFIVSLIAEKLSLPYPLEDKSIKITAKGNHVQLSYQAIDRDDSVEMTLTFTAPAEPAA